MSHLTERIVLAGKEYEVREPSIADNRKFRAEVGPVLQDHLPAVMEKLNAELDFESNQDIAAIALEVGPLLVSALGSIDRMIDLTFVGAPALAEDRDRIETEGRLSEFFGAFLQVLKLNFPLLHWGRVAMDSLTTSIPDIGSNGAATESSSSDPNTESGRTRKRSPQTKSAS